MNRTALAWLPLIAAALLLAACGASHHSIFRHQKLDPARSAIITVDAKQRAILVGSEQTPTTGGGNIRNIQKFCSEPSPDVFSVVAQALSAGGTFGQSADPKSVELALNAAFSSAEQGSTIPRTQTINMLRELMFRTCERYLNGGIGNLELPIQAARDQRLMVSILAIESLTGAVTPKPVVIGAGADASGGASGAEAAVRLDNAYKDLQAKTAAQQARQNDYDGINTDKDHCKQIAEAVAKKEEDKLPQDLKDKRARCESATSALAAAKKQTGDSASHYATLKDTAASGGIPVAATATVMAPKADGGLDRAHEDAVKEVANVVKEIVLANMRQDEFQYFCIKFLDVEAKKSLPPEVGGNAATLEKCQQYLRSQIDVEISRNQATSRSLVREAYQTNRDANLTLFEKFWKAVSKAEKADSALFKKYRLDAISNCFTDGGTKDQYRACFMSNDELTTSDREDLSNLGEQ